ncbi:phage holin family protein [Algoriphagus sp. D3-2-R+10]|uniref:phage holin family protein n=1 Tax=Algoriphagus aurantiacus TaxID=3103948 RepID=UPI002B383456|nr:phage holin family protein [Algoriphagus sp. D3-2-R+10]MEB2775223.1 phage holin family protein [Algoriphagus sp. D3-2-R+10]
MYGYTSGSELIKAIFKNVDNEWVIKILFPLITVIDLIFNFLFQSVGAIYFLIVLYVIDFLTGVAKSIMYSLKIRGLKKQNLSIPKELEDKKLVSKKFPRFLLTLLAALMLLSLVKFAAIHSIIFVPLYSIFYSTFLGQNILSICENLAEMNLVPYKFVTIIKRKITDYNSQTKKQ